MKKIWEKSGKEKLHPMVESFLSGEDIVLDGALVKHEAASSLAHARMLKKTGMLSAAEFAQAEKGLKEIIALHANGQFELKPELEDVHANVEAYLTEKHGVVGKKIHAGRSRNDQVATAMLLYIREEGKKTLQLVEGLCEVLEGLAEKYPWEMPGYTHMQRAMPSTLANLLLSYKESLEADAEFLEAALKVVDKCPLGACAGYGSALPLERAATAKELGFAKLHANTISAVGSRGKNEFMVVSALSAVMLDLGRMAEDMLLFSTKEFGFVSFWNEFATGSSVMPQKKNYDVLELVRAKGARMLGLQVELFATMKALPSGYNRDAQQTKRAVMEAFIEAQGCLAVLALMMKGLKPDKGKMKAACTPEIYAAQKATELAKKGVPFREAYREVAAKG